MNVTERFVELVQGPESDLAVALDEAALLIAAHANPALDMAAYRSRLEALAAGAAASTLEAVTHHLFAVEGFRGNREDFQDPRNSYLDHVLDRRLGIPITLAVVLMEVGRRRGLPLVGVGMPGHFLVRLEAEPPVIVDPFGGGAVLDVAGCEARFRAVHGAEAPFDESLLVPVGPRAILARMLANLRHLYQSTGDARSLGWVLQLRTSIPASSPYELADVASAQAALGRFAEAADTLDAVADLLPDEEVERARAHAGLLRSRLN